MRALRDDRPSDVDILSGCFLFARATAVAKVGMYDERFFIYGEDLDWSVRFPMCGWKTVYYPLAKVVHYGGGSSSRLPLKFHIEMLRSKIMFWEKYYNNLSRAILMVILIVHNCMRIVGSLVFMGCCLGDRKRNRHRLKSSLLTLHWLWSGGNRKTGMSDECT